MKALLYILINLSGLLTITLPTQAQSPRMQLIEEFADEFAVNSTLLEPAFNQLISNNPTKAISIKYIDGAGFGHIGYYTGSLAIHRYFYYYADNKPFPYGMQDGKFFTQAGSTSVGNLDYLTQTEINNRSASLSPFTLTVTHGFTPNLDSVWAQATILCTQSYTAYDSAIGGLRFRIALVEKEIHVQNPTGNNGQRDYYNVMWDMNGFNGVGTGLANVWIPGQTATVYYKEALSAYPIKYMYNLSQIAFVGFIQDDGYNGNTANYSVLQAAASPPVAVPSSFADVGIQSLTTFAPHYCLDSIQPSYKITNYGAVPITNLLIGYTTDSFVSYSAQSWTGNLLQDSSTLVIFPKVAIDKPGGLSLVGRIIQSNGATLSNSINSYANAYDYNCSNNITNSNVPVYFTVATLPVDTAIHEGFQTYDTPYFGNLDQGIQVNPDMVPAVRYKYTGYLSSQSFMWNFLSAREKGLYQKKSAIIFNKLNLTNKQNTGLSFNYAYLKINNLSNDTLSISASLDCGMSWQTVWLKHGGGMATAPDTSIFVKPLPSQWKTVNIDLRTYDNSPELMIKFEAIEAGGNLLFIDNINLGGGVYTGVAAPPSASVALQLYPNPAHNKLLVSSDGLLLEIEVYDVYGRIMNLPRQSLNQQIELDVSNLASGIYFVKVMDKQGRIRSGKFVKTEG
jgi:hypothetical protein